MPLKRIGGRGRSHPPPKSPPLAKCTSPFKRFIEEYASMYDIVGWRLQWKKGGDVKRWRLPCHGSFALPFRPLPPLGTWALAALSASKAVKNPTRRLTALIATSRRRWHVRNRKRTGVEKKEIKRYLSPSARSVLGEAVLTGRAPSLQNGWWKAFRLF